MPRRSLEEMRDRNKYMREYYAKNKDKCLIWAKESRMRTRKAEPKKEFKKPLAFRIHRANYLRLYRVRNDERYLIGLA